MSRGSVAVQETEGLRDVLDGRDRQMVDRRKCEQCVAQMAQDGRVRLAFLYQILDSVEDRREGAETFIR